MFENILVRVRHQALNSEHLETRPALLGAITAQSLASMLAAMIAGSLAAAVQVNASFIKLFVYRLEECLDKKNVSLIFVAYMTATMAVTSDRGN